MDLPFLLYISINNSEENGEVSILVLMDLPFLQHDQWALIKCIFKVSILVLMDLPFLHFPCFVHSIKCYKSFNPCSYGSSVLTIARQIQ